MQRVLLVCFFRPSLDLAGRVLRRPDYRLVPPLNLDVPEAGDLPAVVVSKGQQAEGTVVMNLLQLGDYQVGVERVRLLYRLGEGLDSEVGPRRVSIECRPG